MGRQILPALVGATAILALASLATAQDNSLRRPAVVHMVPCTGIKNLPVIPEDCTCKAILDHVADRLRDNGDDYIVVVDAFSTTDERKGTEDFRGSWAKGYLVDDKGLAEGSVVLRSTRVARAQADPDGAMIFFMLVQRGTQVPPAGTPRDRINQYRQTASN